MPRSPGVVICPVFPFACSPVSRILRSVVEVRLLVRLGIDGPRRVVLIQRSIPDWRPWLNPRRCGSCASLAAPGPLFPLQRSERGTAQHTIPASHLCQTTDPHAPPPIHSTCPGRSKTVTSDVGDPIEPHTIHPSTPLSDRHQFYVSRNKQWQQF
jgi:hypothetical protein